MTAKALLGAVLTYATVAAVLLLSPGTRDAQAIGIGVVGSAIGCLLGIAWFTPAKDTDENVLRRLAVKFAASMTVGVVAGRFTDSVLALVVAIGSALAVVAIVHAIVPVIEGNADGS